MLVADEDVDELGGEVEVALALVVPEVAPFRARDGERIDGRLDRPAVEDVAAVELANALSGLRIRGYEGQRVVTTLLSVKKWTPSMPVAWRSP